MDQRAGDMPAFDGEERERVILKKRPRTESTPTRLSKSKGPSCSKSPIPACSKSPTGSHTHSSSSSEPASMHTEASSTSPPINSPWFRGRGRGNIMRDITFPRIMEDYLQGYREHYAGIDPPVRLQENTVSKLSRVKSFLSFMAHGFNRLSDWLFLRDLKRIRGWSRSLMKSSLQVTTSDFYIKNISHFLKYMADTPCKGSRLSQTDMILIKREVVAILKSLKRKVLIHQMQVKRDKMEGLPSHNDLMTCLTSTTTRIPQLLDVMASNPTTATRTLLYGYMTLHWSCIYGHRPGVYSNMTNAEVRNSSQSHCKQRRRHRQQQQREMKTLLRVLTSTVTALERSTARLPTKTPYQDMSRRGTSHWPNTAPQTWVKRGCHTLPQLHPLLPVINL
ncbi:uncharacterized protein [Pseudochaenichthys georgianus]|uniref:uncharacterized protein n=1 Tax=Pseudochaenichthys georgianus TaxID=52239 RepID=UPI0039C2BC2D